MELNTIKPAAGSKKNRRRVGRGIGSGLGKTAGRGHKGQKSRAGGYHKVGFEGGQMPLQRRVPKIKGFQNPNRVEWAVVNVERLSEAFEPKATVTPEDLLGKGIVRKGLPVKVLGRGDIDRALTVRAHAVSATARTKIEGAGGTIELIESR
jgi:large subunit ribosomal protein L15